MPIYLKRTDKYWVSSTGKIISLLILETSKAINVTIKVNMFALRCAIPTTIAPYVGIL